jgi:hypothetical protein
MIQNLLFVLAALTAAPAPPAPAAIVYALTGEASQSAPGQPHHAVRLFDRLPAGARLEVAPGARLALAFESGKRWELGGGARITLGAKDLGARAGKVSRLPAVPTLPSLAPIRKHDHAGPRAGAVRIRAERIAGLYPRHGTAALAGAVVLRFEPVEGGGKYRVEVQDRQGNAVFSEETATAEVKLPARLLKPGVRYDWTVRTVDRVGPAARGDAGFVTLPARTATAREALRRAVEKAGDSALLALLAEVDRSLGLLAEARDELRAARDGSPGNAALATNFDEIERHLKEDQNETGHPQGIVIEKITPGSAAERAGLQPGDELTAWSSESGGSGALRTPLARASGRLGNRASSRPHARPAGALRAGAAADRGWGLECGYGTLAVRARILKGSD